ncbi:MAG: DUF2520 domain-containing protein [Desulfobacterales bacterium]|nr:DUF2520 domain-containing protein [Desulfobacterales bacterium]
MDNMKPSFAIVGCGKVGTALAIFLSEAGFPLSGLAGRRMASAKRAASLFKNVPFSDDYTVITKVADIVFITTPDGNIEKTCARIVTKGGFKNNAIVLHCSGALPSTILSGDNIHKGSMHPLQSFAKISKERNPFQGINFAVEGSNAAVEVSQEMAIALGGTPIRINTEDKTLYHASAVVSSNYLVTLFDIASTLAEKAGVKNEDVVKLLMPLVKGTISNIENIGITDALTGPIARGDDSVVKKHLDEMDRKTPDLVALYKILGGRTIDIARAKGSISSTAADVLKKLLK